MSYFRSLMMEVETNYPWVDRIIEDYPILETQLGREYLENIARQHPSIDYGVTYITTEGHAYIQEDRYNPSTYTFIIEYKKVNAAWLFGCAYTAGNMSDCGVSINAARYAKNYSASNTNITNALADGEYHKIGVSPYNYYIDGVTYRHTTIGSATNNYATISQPIHILKANNSSLAPSGYVKHFAIINTDGTLHRLFVPYQEGNIIGLFDLITRITRINPVGGYNLIYGRI